MATKQAPERRPIGVPKTPDHGRRWLMLAMATIGFAVNFWAWALLSPLGPLFKEALSLSTFQQALLVAVPVVVGSVGRIPVGALTDRFGGRVMFPLVSVITIVPVLFLGVAGHSSLAALLIGGFFLGVVSERVHGAVAVGVHLEVVVHTGQREYAVRATLIGRDDRDPDAVLLGEQPAVPATACLSPRSPAHTAPPT